MPSWFSPGTPTPLVTNLLAEADWSRSLDPNRWSLWLPAKGRGLESALRGLEPCADGLVAAITGCDALADKRALWIRLVKRFGRERASSVMPETWLLDHAADQKRMLDLPERSALILKNPQLQKRRGILPVGGPAEAMQHLGEGFRLAQREVSNPLLIDDRRFSLRLYLLLQCADGVLSAWLHRSAKILYAEARWSEGRSAESLLSTTRASSAIRPATLDDLIEGCGHSAMVIRQRLKHAMADLVLACEKDLGHWEALEHLVSFQWFGVDVHLDADFKPYVLEVNKVPDMRPLNREDEALKTQVLADFLKQVGVLAGEPSSLDLITDTMPG